MFGLPYSPRWLAQEGRHEEAFSALMRLHGGKTDPAVVKYEYDEITTQMEWERENVSSKFSDLWSTRASLRRTLCGVMVQVCCQWTGVNVNSYFGPTIYKALGFTGSRILLISGISGAAGVVGQCIIRSHQRRSRELIRPPSALLLLLTTSPYVETFTFITFMVDRIGRRKPLLWGGILMACCLAWQAGCSSAFDGGKQGSNAAGIAGESNPIYTFGLTFSQTTDFPSVASLRYLVHLRIRTRLLLVVSLQHRPQQAGLDAFTYHI